jgi:hypothetical protein
VAFDPSTTGAKTGDVVVHSNSADVSVAVSGTGTQTLLTQSPATLPFGSQDIDDGPSPAQESTITNTGSEPVTLFSMSSSGPDAGLFQRQTDAASDCATGDTIQPGANCKLRFRFDPDTTGGKSAGITLSSNAADVAVALSGTGTQSLLAPDPGALAFGRRGVAAPPTAAQTTTVTNTGSEPITLSGLDLSGDAGQFERLSGDPADCATGSVLAAAATCQLRVRFDPSSSGPKNAVLTVASNTADITVALTGTGTPSVVIGSGPKKASSTAGKRFKVAIGTRGGTVKGVGVTLTTKGGRRLGGASLGTIGGKVTAAIKLKRKLAPGSYVVTARGRAGGKPVEVARKTFKLK